MEQIDPREMARCLFDESNDAFLVFDPDTGVLLEANPASLRLFALRHCDLVGRPFSDLFPESTEINYEEILNAFRETGAVSHPEDLEVLLPDGSSVPVSLTASRLHIKPKPLGLAILRDITLQRKAEERLRDLNHHLEAEVRDRTANLKQRNEELLRWETIFLHSATGVALADPDSHRLILANPTFARMHGYDSPDEMLDRSFEDFLAPHSRELLPVRSQVVHEQGHHSYESVHQRRDGSTFWCLSHVTAYMDEAGRVKFRAGQFLDISEAKAAATKLDESQRALLEAQSISHVGNWVYRVADGDIEWSDELYRIFGLEPQSEKLTYNRLLELLHPDDRGRHEDYMTMLAGVALGGNPPAMEYLINRADGAQRSVHVETKVNFDCAGRQTSYRGTVQDITEQRTAEKQLQDQLAELRRWHAVSLDREDRIIELKTEVNALLRELGRKAAYAEEERFDPESKPATKVAPS